MPGSQRIGPRLELPFTLCKARLLQTLWAGEHLVTALCSTVGPPRTLVLSPWGGCDTGRAVDRVSPRGQGLSLKSTFASFPTFGEAPHPRWDMVEAAGLRVEAGPWPVHPRAAQAVPVPRCYEVCLSGKAAGTDGPHGRLQVDALAPRAGGKCP